MPSSCRSIGRTAENGGVIDQYWQPGQLIQELDDVVFTLQSGDVLQYPIQIADQWHVIKVTDHRTQPPPAYDDLRDQLQQQLVTQAYTNELDTLRAAADIQMMDAAYGRKDAAPASGAAAPADRVRPPRPLRAAARWAGAGRRSVVRDSADRTMAKLSPLAPASFPLLPPIAGVRLMTAAAGIRYQGRDDVLVMVVDEGTTVAGVLTQLEMSVGAGRMVPKRAATRDHARAILVNSGNANAFTGRRGREATQPLRRGDGAGAGLRAGRCSARIHRCHR